MATGKVMNLREAPTYSRIRLREWGSIDEVQDEVSFAVDDVVTLWTDCCKSGNAWAAVDVRGVLGTDLEIQWLPDDATVEIVHPPRFAGHPEDLIRGLEPIKPPEGSKGSIATPEGFHALIWDSEVLFSPVQGWTDPQLSVEVLLCALNVVPDDELLRSQMLAALRARFAAVTRDPRTYPPAEHPWRAGLEVGQDLLEYLRG